MKFNNKLILIIFLTPLIGTFSIALIGGEDNELNIVGSTTVLPIAQRALELFTKVYPDYSVTLKGGGSSVGITSLINGTTDIADASRPLKDKELNLASNKGVNPIEFAIAKDGIAIVVHPANPVEKLTFEQIAQVYTNPRINSWKHIGGPDMPLVVVSRETTSGTYGSFVDLIIEEIKGRGARLRPDIIYTGSNAEMAETLASAEGAIGYIGMGYLSGKIKAVKVSKDGDNFIKASLSTVREGTYPVSRSLYMYIDGQKTNGRWEPNKPVIATWLNFIYSYMGQCSVKELGYVSLFDVDDNLCKYLFSQYKAKYLG